MGRAAIAEIPAADRAVSKSDNQPDTFEAHRVNIEDLCDIEARNWADGEPIATQAQADEVQALIRKIQEAETAADASRIAEKTPYDEKVKAIQDKYNPLIAGPKTSKPGKTSKAIAALNVALTAWLLKVKAEQDAAALKARLESEAKLKVAQEAAQAAAQSSNIEVRERAEELIVEAQQADRAATRAETARPTASGYGRAAGLRDHYVATGFAAPVAQDDGSLVTGETLALRHYIATRRDALVQAAFELAQADVRSGARSIPGIVIQNQPRAV